jgi:hypothetical protein
VDIQPASDFPYFDLEAARSLLPWLRDKLEELKEVKALIEESIELGRRSLISTYTFKADSIVKEITRKGIVLRDVDLGLVDFPAIINGSPAYLCWRDDEVDIQYWHYADEGYSGRKRLTGKEDILSLT